MGKYGTTGCINNHHLEKMKRLQDYWKALLKANYGAITYNDLTEAILACANSNVAADCTSVML